MLVDLEGEARGAKRYMGHFVSRACFLGDATRLRCPRPALTTGTSRMYLSPLTELPRGSAESDDSCPQAGPQQALYPGAFEGPRVGVTGSVILGVWGVTGEADDHFAIHGCPSSAQRRYHRQPR